MFLISIYALHPTYWFPMNILRSLIIFVLFSLHSYLVVADPCASYPGVTTVGCPDGNGIKTASLIVDSCTEYTYTGPEHLRYKFIPDESYTIVITSQNIPNGKSIFIGRFSCDSGSGTESCHLYVLDSTTTPEIKLFMDGKPFFTIQGRGSITFMVDSGTCDEVHICGGHHTTPSGVIGSPNHPEHHENYQDCYWHIDLPGLNDRIVLEFTFFEVEKGTRSTSSYYYYYSYYFSYIDTEDRHYCDFDFVAIYDGSNNNAPLYGKFCGVRKPKEFVSLGSHLYIHFHSDLSVTTPGFRATYSTITEAPPTVVTDCGGTETGASGVITSPSFPDAHGHNLRCDWIIDVQHSRVQLIFTHFDVEDVPDCHYDYVMVFDGPTDTSRSLGIFCGDRRPSSILATSHQMLVRFYADHSHALPGFRAEYSRYRLPCSSHLTATSGVFTSEGYPDEYSDDHDCEWLIEGPAGSQVTLTFTDFHIELESYSCSFDSVMIYDGPDNQATITYGRYCGDTAPPVINSTGNTLYILFHTDGSVVEKGFQAQYTIE